MQFAVVDIETTGGTPSNSRITEICVVITDGTDVLQEFESLLNPGFPIPRGITSLTGIDDEMVASAPVFADIAQELYHLLHDKVFVAHNVNFDYGFIQKEFERIGQPFSLPKICTVRTARKAFPGKRSYGLGSICSSLGIVIEGRHRAGGDARATTILFQKIVSILGQADIEKIAGKSGKTLVLPPGLENTDIEKLPSTPGVYYFLNRSGKALYVGKAKNIKKRVLQHFDKKTGKTALQLEKVASINFEEAGSELIALLIEAEAIQKQWPEWNKSGKSPSNRYSIVHYPTGNGELRLQTIRRARNSPTGIGFARLNDARNSLGKIIRDHAICNSLAYSNTLCFDESCYCKSEITLRLSIHNDRILKAISAFSIHDDEFIILCPGKTTNEIGVVYMADGAVLGWGFVDELPTHLDPDMLVKKIKDNGEMRAIANTFLRRISAGSTLEYKILTIEKEQVNKMTEPQKSFSTILLNVKNKNTDHKQIPKEKTKSYIEK